MEQLKVLFRRWAGEPCTKCLALGANGSSRRYYRLVGDTHRCIGAIASDVRENEAFFAYSRHLLARGIRVPELYAVDDDRIHYLQQDLGDQTLYGLLYEKKQKGGGFDAQMLALYRQALADLHDIQVAGRDMDFSIAYPRPAFDTRSILWDLNYFKYNYLKLQHIPFDENRLEDDFQHLADTLLSADTNYFLYRDFNPRNIMVAESEKCALHTSHPPLSTTSTTRADGAARRSTMSPRSSSAPRATSPKPYATSCCSTTSPSTATRISWTISGTTSSCAYSRPSAPTATAASSSANPTSSRASPWRTTTCDASSKTTPTSSPTSPSCNPL